MTYHRVSGSWGESGIHRSDLSDGALSRSTPMPSLLVTNTRAGLGWARLGWAGWDCYSESRKFGWGSRGERNSRTGLWSLEFVKDKNSLSIVFSFFTLCSFVPLFLCSLN